MSGVEHDLGSGFAYRFFQWDPGDLALNPQNRGKVKIDPAGIVLLKDGIPVGGCWFDSPAARAVVEPGRAMWELHSLDPLHLEPSIQTRPFEWGDPPSVIPGYHGHIRDGRWQPA